MQTTNKTINGVDVNRLFTTIDTIKATPGLAKFKFRIRNQWEGCGYNRSTVKDFYGTEQDIPHARNFVLEADEPEILLGQDKGANPVEHLLHALAACVTTSMVYHAAAKGVEIQEVESSIDGDIDLKGFLGLDPSIRNGFQQIRMNFRIKADATDEQIQEIVKLGPTYSPVYDSVTKGVPVVINATAAR